MINTMELAVSRSKKEQLLTSAYNKIDGLIYY
jgi:hypothetical protein